MLFGDYEIRNLLVNAFRKDVSMYQIVFPLIWPVVDDALRVSFADAGQAHQLNFAGRVQIHQLAGIARAG